MPRPKLFADQPETITVADLRDGDFLVSFPTQRGIRGYAVNSGVTELEADHTWGVRPGYRQRLIPTEARHFRTLTGVGLSLPSDCTVVVRRRLATV
jgi:hypothetical protein